VNSQYGWEWASVGIRNEWSEIQNAVVP
jgi:hypothetical protein